MDLFERKEARIWVLPIDCAIGRWHIVAVFNWNETAEETVPLDFAKMGLDPAVDYVVFDFWPGEYCGIMKEKAELRVPAGSVRLLCMRPFENHPMFLSTDAHILQGAVDFDALEWNAASRTLQGIFRGIENTEYRLSILAPESYLLSESQVSAKDMRTERDGEVIRLICYCGATAPVAWNMKF